MRGRRPKPAAVRLREGNPGRRPVPKPVLVGPPAELEPPDGLNEDGRAFWAEVVPPLAEAGVISRVDCPGLEMLATAYARFRAASRYVEEHGPVSEGSRGQPRESPAIRTQCEAARDYLRFAEQFGLTASARTRLGLAELQRRRSMVEEMRDSLGPAELEPAD